jgi:hypothetical protein
MFLLRSLSANSYYYYLNLFSKRRCRIQLENLKIHGENLKILKMRSNKSGKPIEKSKNENLVTLPQLTPLLGFSVMAEKIQSARKKFSQLTSF